MNELPKSVDEMADILDIAEIYTSQAFSIILWTLVVIAVCAVIALVIFVLYRLSKRRLAEKALSPRERALEGMRLLQRSDHSKNAQWHSFYLLLDEILRRYISEEFACDVLDRTVEELKHDLEKVCAQAKGLDRTWFKEFLERVQTIKFAKGLSTADVCQNDYKIVKEFVLFIHE